MEIVLNAYHIKVKKICASCQYKECMGDGTMVSQKMGLVVDQKFVCPKWQMSDSLKNAGLQTGGVVRLIGTAEIIIK